MKVLVMMTTVMRRHHSCDNRATLIFRATAPPKVIDDLLRDI